MAHVWIIEDNVPFRQGLLTALALPPHPHQTEAFGTCEEAIARLGGAPTPDVILLDVGLPQMDGITGIAHLKAGAPETSILILTVFEDDEKIFAAICAGASGYLLKTQSIASILHAVDEAMAGGSPMNPQIARRVLAMFTKFAPSRRDFGLTEREFTALGHMAAGLTRKQIPDAMKLNRHTVDYVIRSIYRKLHVNCAAAAVSIAVRERLVREPPPEG